MDVSVRIVVKRRPDINFCELLPLEGTPSYRAYVKDCTRQGLPIIWYVQLFTKAGSSSQVEEEVRGAEVEVKEDVESSEGANEELDNDGEEGGDAKDDVAAREPNGEADEGEEIAELIEQVEREVEEANDAMDDDSSDEKDAYPIPRNWSN